MNKRKPLAIAIAASIRSLVERPGPAPVRYPPVLHMARCHACGNTHSIAVLCPQGAWERLQQQKGKTP